MNLRCVADLPHSALLNFIWGCWSPGHTHSWICRAVDMAINAQHTRIASDCPNAIWNKQRGLHEYLGNGNKDIQIFNRYFEIIIIDLSRVHVQVPIIHVNTAILPCNKGLHFAKEKYRGMFAGMLHQNKIEELPRVNRTWDPVEDQKSFSEILLEFCSILVKVYKHVYFTEFHSLS